MRVVVIGAGLAGLTAALAARGRGHEVTLVSFGVGGLPLSPGVVDVLGYAPERVERPLDAMAGLGADHPYAALGADRVREGAALLRGVLGDLLVGDGESNWLLPTAVGAMRPTLLAQPSMVAGSCVAGARFAIVGVRQLKDFWPELIAGNLSRTPTPDGGRVEARASWVDAPSRPGEVDATGVALARVLDDPVARSRFAAALVEVTDADETVGVPAILGVTDAGAHADLEHRSGRRIFEIPLPPPSVPGLRLHQRLWRANAAAGVRLILGSAVVGHEASSGRLVSLSIGTAGHPSPLPVDAVIHAGGGFSAGTLHLDSYGHLAETIFDLPLVGVPDEPFAPEARAAQPVFAAGVATDDRCRPVGTDGSPVYENLFAIGDLLAGAQRWREKSGDGIALASAVLAASQIGGES